MHLLALIGFVWLSCCVTAVALCGAARRGDEAAVIRSLAAAAAEQDVPFVATFANPETEPTRVPAPSTQRSAA